MSDVADQIKDGNIMLTASPFSNIGKQDVLKNTVDVPATVTVSIDPTSSRFGNSSALLDSRPPAFPPNCRQQMPCAVQTAPPPPTHRGGLYQKKIFDISV